MKKHYLHWTQRIWLVLLWAGLVSQNAWAQSVPDAQWARLGRTLAITTDGNIVTNEDAFIVKYALNGDKLRQTGLLQGTSYIGGKLAGCPQCTVNGYSWFAGFSQLAPTADGGVLLLGSEYGSAFPLLGRLNINLGQVLAANGKGYVIGTPDGSYVLASNGPDYSYVTYTYTQHKVVQLSKSSAQTASSWMQTLSYPAPNPTTPDSSLTKANVVINTPDGGYVVAGYFNARGNDSPESGWVAKLDGQGNVVWQKLLTGLPRTDGINGSSPGEIYAMSTVNDVSVLADGTGYALVGTGLLPGSVGGPPPATALLEIDLNGEFRRGRGKAIDAQSTTAFITLYTGSGGKKYYAVGNSSLQNGSDPQILLIDPATLAVAAKRTFNGPDDGVLTDIGVAGDGSLVFSSSGNQVVKLVAETFSTGGSLALTQPTYDCNTGAISFNTTGGNGSPITYSAPGIMRASASSNTGTVEQGLRNDPKVIPITATQNGISVTYNFDLRAACSSTPTPKAPLYTPIPDQTYAVGKDVFFPFGDYFSDPTGSVPNYSPDWLFTVTGLPDGLDLSIRVPYLRVPNVPILGIPTKAGTYTVNVTASTSAFRDTPIRTSFRITILPNGQPPVTPPTPPTGGSLALTQPTYDCSTGAITFNTSGGDGSPITFSAPGISRTSATSNSGTVEQGLRNDPKPLTIIASQNGQSATYVFDFKTYCVNPQTPPAPPTPPTPPVGTALALLAPTYDCASGAITFRSSGGNGSPVEYASPGITDWTSNPNQFVDRDARTANDVKPFTLMARQNGVVVSYTWDLKAACGRGVSARLGAPEQAAGLSISVLGNPVSDALTVEIRGVEGQPLVLRLLDLSGRLLESRSVERTAETEHHRFDLSPTGPGLLLLRASSGNQSKTVKILRQ